MSVLGCGRLMVIILCDPRMTTFLTKLVRTFIEPLSIQVDKNGHSFDSECSTCGVLT